MGDNKFYSTFRRTCLLWLVLLFTTLVSRAQVSNIGGIVNSYYPVLEVIPAKACVRVNNASTLSTIEKVLLVQMKGASIITTNNSSYGDTTSLNNAGNYEVATICTIVGDSVFFVFNLLNNYTVTDKVQLVTIAQYENANVTSTLKAQPWNNATGTGGVIAIEVVDTLELNADISADSAGYAGGLFFDSGNFCTNTYTGYIYNPTIEGGYKGEGVFEIALNVNGGRGAPANGGGGGNNHNNGAGGGANLSGGGIGGGNSSTISGGCTASFQGRGGKALSGWNGQKIFMGGGGGAGHNNNGFTTTEGGNGGGIIFIHADTLIGNGFKISANGDEGGASLSDGAGAGGAGGTIILDINAYLTASNVEAKGGKGGDSNDGGNIQRCYGAGGGGSGGVIYLNSATTILPTTTTNAGAAGIEYGRDAGCSAMVPSAAGNAGTVINNYSYRYSTSLASYCGVALPVTLHYFTATKQSTKVLLTWSLANAADVMLFVIEKKNQNNQWESIASVNSIGSQQAYSYIDNSLVNGYNFYRIKIIEANNNVSFSPNRSVFIEMNSEITVYPNPSKNKIILQGSFKPGDLLQLFDTNGRILFETQLLNNPAQLFLPTLIGGVYILKVNNSIVKLLMH